MPNYAKLRELMSHRVSVEYDTGAKITGYLAGCRPGQGPVQFVTLTKVEMFDAEGNMVEQHEELALCPNVLTGFNLDEGPRGRDH
jgi:hypothetical protein